MSSLQTFCYDADILISCYLQRIERYLNLELPGAIKSVIALFYPLYQIISSNHGMSQQFALNLINNPNHIYYYNENQLIIMKQNSNQLYSFKTTNSNDQHITDIIQLYCQLFKNIENDDSCYITSINDKFHASTNTMLSLNTGEVYKFSITNNKECPVDPVPMNYLNESLKPSTIFMEQYLDLKSTCFEIEQIACSTGCMLLLSNTDGHVWYYGHPELNRNSYYWKSGGITASDNDNTVPWDIEQISCGIYNNFFLLTKYGKLYCFGNNQYGQIGAFGNSVNFMLHPVFQYKCIINVCCGYYHTVVIDENYQCFIFGLNDYGQIGDGNHGPGQCVFTPIHIQYIHKYMEYSLIVDAYLSRSHTVLLDDHNDLYVFGDNSKYQISNKCVKRLITKPIKLDSKKLGIDENDTIVKLIMDETNTYIIVESSAKVCRVGH